jgi:hypothetical protein
MGSHYDKISLIFPTVLTTQFKFFFCRFSIIHMYTVTLKGTGGREEGVNDKWWLMTDDDTFCVEHRILQKLIFHKQVQLMIGTRWSTESISVCYVNSQLCPHTQVSILLGAPFLAEPMGVPSRGRTWTLALSLHSLSEYAHSNLYQCHKSIKPHNVIVTVRVYLSLDISQPYQPSWPVTGIDLHFYLLINEGPVIASMSESPRYVT